MAAIAWSDVVGLDARLSAVPEALQTVILGRVEQLSAAFFGGASSAKYKLARMLLAAHMGFPLVTGGVAAGPIIAESEGGASRSYAVIHSALAGEHGSTRFGSLFDDLVRSSPRRIGLTS